MIKLYTAGNNQLEQAAGRAQLEELQRLRKQLETCFSNAGIREDWLLDHLLMAVAERVFEDSSETSLSVATKERDDTADELGKIVTKLLVDAGYPDVAARFSHLRGLTTEKLLSSRHHPWDETRLFDLISKRLPLTDQAARTLARRLTVQLQELGFRNISDNLVYELAEHNLDELAQKERRKVSQEAADWLVTPGFWEAFFPSEIARLTRTGILRIQPVSQLFPVPRVTLQCDNLVEEFIEKPVTELSLLPALREVCHNIAEVVDILISQTGSDRKENDVQAYLVVQGLQNTVRKTLQPSSKKSGRQPIAELTEVIRKTLAENCPHELVVLVQD